MQALAPVPVNGISSIILNLAAVGVDQTSLAAILLTNTSTYFLVVTTDLGSDYLEPARSDLFSISPNTSRITVSPSPGGSTVNQTAGFLYATMLNRNDPIQETYPVPVPTTVPQDSGLSGEMKLWAGAAIPSPLWNFCDGTVFNVADQPNLFAAIGYKYGGAGATFAVPNMGNRVPIGASIAFYPLGSQGGESTHILTPAEMPGHWHSGVSGATDLNHNHPYDVTQWLAWRFAASAEGLQNASTGTRVTLGSPGSFTTSTPNVGMNHAHTIPIDGGNVAHNNVQPYMAVNFIIRL